MKIEHIVYRSDGSAIGPRSVYDADHYTKRIREWFESGSVVRLEISFADGCRSVFSPQADPELERLLAEEDFIDQRSQLMDLFKPVLEGLEAIRDRLIENAKLDSMK